MWVCVAVRGESFSRKVSPESRTWGGWHPKLSVPATPRRGVLQFWCADLTFPSSPGWPLLMPQTLAKTLLFKEWLGHSFIHSFIDSFIQQNDFWAPTMDQILLITLYFQLSNYFLSPSLDCQLHKDRDHIWYVCHFIPSTWHSAWNMAGNLQIFVEQMYKWMN